VDCVLIRFVHWPVSMIRHFIGVRLERTPEIANHAVDVIYRFRVWFVRSGQQYCEASRKRFNVILHISEAIPNQVSHSGFSAEIRYGNGALSGCRKAPFTVSPL
jgi:hypothetical protein